MKGLGKSNVVHRQDPGIGKYRFLLEEKSTVPSRKTSLGRRVQKPVSPTTRDAEGSKRRKAAGKNEGRQDAAKRIINKGARVLGAQTLDQRAKHSLRARRAPRKREGEKKLRFLVKELTAPTLERESKDSNEIGKPQGDDEASPIQKPDRAGRE